MTKVHVIAKRDFLESLTSARPLAALAELVWNGFDAQSDRVQIHLDLNELEGLQSIRVRDYGTGIDLSQIESLFGSLGESWKKNKARLQGRPMHGKSGKGRFKAFALGQHIEWNTTCLQDGKAYSYKITGNFHALDDFDISAPTETEGAMTGTEVVVSNIQQNFRSLLSESAPLDLARVFAAYLTEYPGLSLEYNGISIDPKTAQKHSADYHLGDVGLSDDRKTTVAVSIIEWNMPTERVLHWCDAKGISLYETEAGQQIRAPGFNFTAYIKSDHFLELDKQNQLILEELHPDVDIILKVARAKIKEHFRRRLAEDQSKVVARWKNEHIYPYGEETNLNPVEEAERQVFDILAVNVQSYLPSFEDSDKQSKKFTFRLLAQAIHDNPSSVQQIIGEVLGLKKEAQDELAELLKKTTLSSIIGFSKIVANRLDFLLGLETLIFDKENKKQLLERDQLHKILENETWIFSEEFGLAGSEERLDEVLRKHLAKLGKREDNPEAVMLADEKTGRVDLMLHKVVQPRTGEYDYLIVELKRPSKKVDSEVLSQIEGYAMAVANDERFHGVKTRWTFIAVSNDLDDFVKRKTNQRGWPIGKVYDDAVLNITVWAKPWADVINDARSRLRFFSEQLSYEANRDSAKAYLKKAHEKFIPNLDLPKDNESDKVPLSAP
ncbi:MAG: ATP-binding protein [Nitrospira sp.]|nr:ATP-binding protein [Nitrospira sp.]